MEFQDFTNWLMNLSMAYGYFGILLVSLLGRVSIFFPVPDTLVIFTLAGLKVGGRWAFDIVWIALLLVWDLQLENFQAIYLA